MILYGAPISPYVRKVRSYLAERGMEAELVPTAAGADDPGFRACSPLGKIPALQDGDFGIADSSAIIAFLEAKYPGSGLVPESAEGKAWVLWWDKFADTVLAPSGAKIFINRVVAPKYLKIAGNEATAKEGEAEFPKHYTYLEGAIQPSGYLVGDRFSFADIAVATVLGNVRFLGLGPDASAYPKLTAWLEASYARPSIAAPFASGGKIFAWLMDQPGEETK